MVKNINTMETEKLQEIYIFTENTQPVNNNLELKTAIQFYK